MHANPRYILSITSSSLKLLKLLSDRTDIIHETRPSVALPSLLRERFFNYLAALAVKVIKKRARKSIDNMGNDLFTQSHEVEIT